MGNEEEGLAEGGSTATAGVGEDVAKSHECG
jgi:hypothetical protein